MRWRRLRALVLFPLVSLAAGENWRRWGRQAFLEYLVAIGCGECGKLVSLPDSEKVSLQLSSQIFGCADVDVLLSSLHWIYEDKRRMLYGDLPGILVDGGANVGRASARWIASFGDGFGRRISRNETHRPWIVCAGSSASQGDPDAASEPPTLIVLAIEPSSANFELLTRHAREGRWEDEGFVAIKAALGGESGEANLAVSKDFSIDEVATLLIPTGDERERELVRVVTLGEAVAAVSRLYSGIERVRAGHVFLLKLDVEGLEPLVLRTLKEPDSPSVKFVSFEYASNVWQEPLAPLIQELFDAGYFCFLITAQRLFPVSGPFWDPIYEMAMWSNYVCGRTEDEDVEALVQLHHGQVGIWPRQLQMQLPEALGDGMPRPLLKAQQYCEEFRDDCAGVTCQLEGDDVNMLSPPSHCTARSGLGGLRPAEFQVSFLRDITLADLYLRWRRGQRCSLAAC